MNCSVSMSTAVCHSHEQPQVHSLYNPMILGLCKAGYKVRTGMRIVCGVALVPGIWEKISHVKDFKDRHEDASRMGL